jgi:hypothetical protein
MFGSVSVERNGWMNRSTRIARTLTGNQRDAEERVDRAEVRALGPAGSEYRSMKYAQ